MTSAPIKISKGLDIKLVGEAEKKTVTVSPRSFACKPIDFTGVFPRMLVQEGDEVMAGSPVYADKQHPEILFASPVSGTVKEIRRGAKRLLLEIVIEPDGKTTAVDFGKADPGSLSREQITDKMLRSGVWPVVRQRPYNTIARPGEDPKAIVISAFDTNPLAPDYNFLMEGEETAFQAGLDALKNLTSGKIYLNLRGDTNTSKVFLQARGVELTRFTGPHPAGNVSTQISRLDPIGKGEVIWHLRPQEVLVVGRLFLTGAYDATRIIALTGSMVKRPAYYKMPAGACIHDLVENNIHEGTSRYISGNVLTGTRITGNGYTGFYDSQVTVIPEGNFHEFLGWALPGLNKHSFHNMFLSRFLPGKKFDLDTNLHGGERAFVMTGKYEQVFPFDIYPMQLLKAILAEDIDLMENLGIYEIDAEDFALAEFIDTSKIELQSIVRQGLELLRKENT
jgi:Na+-transporting NADH:ubiquinone oxidoreductase subunit A